MNALPDPKPGRLWLLVLPRGAFERMWDLAARMAARGPLRVLDAGNCFDVYAVIRRLDQLTPERETALGRLSIVRAFTCYQAAASLEKFSADGVPMLVLELLSTFYDENVQLAERRLLLSRCAAALQRLSAAGPVAVGERPPPATPIEIGSPHPEEARFPLLRILEDAADQVWWFEPPAPGSPPRLF